VGNFQFFENMFKARRSRTRARNLGRAPEIDFAVLCFWFAGHLWLMTDDVGSHALRQYLKSSGTPREGISAESYKKARRKLKLKGYRAFTRKAPVRYDPATKRYSYRTGWGKKLAPL